MRCDFVNIKHFQSRDIVAKSRMASAFAESEKRIEYAVVNPLVYVPCISPEDIP